MPTHDSDADDAVAREAALLIDAVRERWGASEGPGAGEREPSGQGAHDHTRGDDAGEGEEREQPGDAWRQHAAAALRRLGDVAHEAARSLGEERR